MRKFFALKFISGLYKVFALLTAIISLVWAGLVIGDSILTTRTIEISINSDWSWFQQTFTVLIIGGLLSLTFFVISEIIEAILASYEVSKSLLEQINRSNDLNEKLIKSQSRLAKNIEDISASQAVNQQIAARKTNIKVDTNNP